MLNINNNAANVKREILVKIITYIFIYIKY